MNRCTVSPWEENPYRLVSWWQMEKFSADIFYRISKDLAELKAIAEKNDDEKHDMKEDTRIWFSDFFREIGKKCSGIGLHISDKAARSVAFAYKNADGKNDTGIAQRLETLQATIEWEMEDIKFFHMPADRAKFFDCPEMFGKSVNSKFPEIQFDMIEAGNCYASGRGTACVFHLMRIMEVGVQRFGTRVGVPLADEKVWQIILDGINKAIKLLPPKNLLTIKLCAVSANLYSVKLAWRNEVMHPKETYTLEEAENILRQVNIYMTELAEIVE
jgi:hypothetical protein